MLVQIFNQVFHRCSYFGSSELIFRRVGMVEGPLGFIAGPGMHMGVNNYVSWFGFCVGWHKRPCTKSGGSGQEPSACGV